MSTLRTSGDPLLEELDQESRLHLNRVMVDTDNVAVVQMRQSLYRLLDTVQNLPLNQENTVKEIERELSRLTALCSDINA